MASVISRSGVAGAVGLDWVVGGGGGGGGRKRVIRHGKKHNNIYQL